MKKNPPNHPSYRPPKSGVRKVRNPNGTGTGWIDRDGHVWVPEDHKGTHGQHWDVQNPSSGGHVRIFPFAKPSDSPLNFEISPTAVKVGIAIGIIVLIIVTDGAAAPLLAL